MTDVDKYDRNLNDRLATPAFDSLSAADISRLLKGKKQPVTKRFKLFFRIEIVICLAEIVQEAFIMAEAKDAMSAGYSCINILISAVFIGIFIRLIRKLNDPVLVTLPLRQHLEKVLTLTRSFYNNYLRFMLIYVVMDFCFGLARFYLVGLTDEYGKGFIRWVDSLTSPVYRSLAVMGYHLLLSVLTYFICRLIIRLFYRKGLVRLQQVYDDIREF